LYFTLLRKKWKIKETRKKTQTATELKWMKNGRNFNLSRRQYTTLENSLRKRLGPVIRQKAQ